MKVFLPGVRRDNIRSSLPLVTCLAFAVYLAAGCAESDITTGSSQTGGAEVDAGPSLEAESVPPPLMTPDAGKPSNFIPIDGPLPSIDASTRSGDAAMSFAMPSDFTKTDIGGFKLGAMITGAIDVDVDAGASCNSIILGVVRDFRGIDATEPDLDAGKGGHPDFQHFLGQSPTKGLVANDLGADEKPVYASKCEAISTGSCPNSQQTTSKAYFDQWYRNTPGVNLPYLVNFFLAPTNGLFTFESEYFFPLDGAGWGLSELGEDGKNHNFHFTTEVHTAFVYNGGETFSFAGDDDLWVFVNKKLAIDLGGLHGRETGSVVLDMSAATFGLQKGSTYPLDLFHAERRSGGSHFRIDTNLSFTNCGTLPPDIVN